MPFPSKEIYNWDVDQTVVFNRVISISISVINKEALKKWMKKHCIDDYHLYCRDLDPNRMNIYIEDNHFPTKFSLYDVEKEMGKKIFTYKEKKIALP